MILGNGVGDRLDVPAGPARRRPRVRRAHRPAGVELSHRARPRRGRRDTWGGDSWKITGPHERLGADEPRRGARARLSAGRHAEQRLLRRPAARRRVCTATRSCASTPRPACCKWYFQIAHHGLWDYDPASAPSARDDDASAGAPIDGVVQLTKQGFAFVFDRVTGKPMWPIEERPVPRERRARRARVADAAVPDAPGAVHSAGHDARRRVRPDAGAAGGGAARSSAGSGSGRCTRRRRCRDRSSVRA